MVGTTGHLEVVVRDVPDSNVTDVVSIDTKRFARMFAKETRRLKTAFVETAVTAPPDNFAYYQFDPNLTLGDGRFAVVWCFYAKGQPHKYTGCLRDIRAHILNNGRPCLLSISRSKRASRSAGLWEFCNAPGLLVRTLPWGLSFAPLDYRRVGNNDHFLVTYTVKGVVVKSKRYRQMPQAFPRDFLDVVGVRP
jgi:hypothetical protein